MSDDVSQVFTDLMQRTPCGARHPDHPGYHCARQRGHAGKHIAAIRVEWEDAPPPDLNIFGQDNISVSDNLGG